MSEPKIEYWNGLALIANDTHLCKWIKESGRLDHDTNMLPRVLPYIPEGGFVVDVGGYVGDHTIAYSEAVGPNGAVIAFEPYRLAFECLKYNMKDKPNVVCEFAALGAIEGIARIDCKIENYGMAAIGDSGEEVELTTLDARMKGATRFDLLKIDSEGTEIEVLKGGKKTIDKFKPIMLIEVNEHTLKLRGYTKQDLLNAISELGYRYRNVYEGQGLDGDQFDVLCFPL
jgi:FkbM family methyltransferase